MGMSWLSRPSADTLKYDTLLVVMHSKLELSDGHIWQSLLMFRR